MAQSSDYPVQYSVDYPESSNRITVLFRLILAIPSLVIVALVQTLVLPTFLMVVFRRKYPRWWFDFNLEALRFASRFGAYLGLMQDAYPSTDEYQAVHLDIEYPDNLNRFLPLVKWFLAIPHYIVLWILGMISLLVVVVAWFAILFTGRFPRALFDFNLGVTRWSIRVQAYAFVLTTDRYPPFRLSP